MAHNVPTGLQPVPEVPDLAMPPTSPTGGGSKPPINESPAELDSSDISTHLMKMSSENREKVSKITNMLIEFIKIVVGLSNKKGQCWAEVNTGHKCPNRNCKRNHQIPNPDGSVKYSWPAVYKMLESEVVRNIFMLFNSMKEEFVHSGFYQDKVRSLEEKHKTRVNEFTVLIETLQTVIQEEEEKRMIATDRNLEYERLIRDYELEMNQLKEELTKLQEELKRKPDEVNTTGSCTICGDTCEGYMCSCNNFTCKDCLVQYYTDKLNVSGTTTAAELTKYVGDKGDGVPSMYSVNGCTEIISPLKLGKINDNLFKLYIKAIEAITTNEISILESKASMRKTRERQDMSTDELFFTAMKESIDSKINRVMGCCGQPYADHTGCAALVCPRCPGPEGSGQGICAWCLTCCGSDAHSHVAHCPVVPKGIDDFTRLYPSQKLLNDTSKERNIKIIQEDITKCFVGGYNIIAKQLEAYKEDYPEIETMSISIESLFSR